MKKNLFLIFLFFGLAGLSQKPVPLIFDTDIAPDYDDVGAMAILHAFADKGEVKILATISCNAFETTAATLSVLNTYFRRPEVPVGVIKSDFPNKACSQGWAQVIVKDYPHNIHSNNEAEDALQLYRKILASQPDTSVTIVSVGFFSNLAKLLESVPDRFSDLDGATLVRKKVKRLVSMAARLGKNDSGAYEFNVATDPRASQIIFSQWPTPIILSGFGIGEKILTGIHLINNEVIRQSPVKDAFRVALTADHNSLGRNSWDETAVWVAVRGFEPYFNYRKLKLSVLPDGKNIIIPGEKFIWLEFKAEPETIARGLEELMMHQPSSKK
jgi:inosine-uridine nucleoside N-ribohydrolase